MKWEEDIMSNSSSWMIEDSLKSTIWTPIENKLFENALAKFDKDTPDRWHRVEEMVPGKTVSDVMRQYKELVDDVSSIEAGFSPKYRYNNSNSSNCGITLESGNNQWFDRCIYPPYGGVGEKRSPAVVAACRPVEQERKKGVPWTEEEHKLFLLGLKKYGKGDWRNISRNYVVTRTPTQVASHAQKYFIRQLSGGKDKRRASIHDITTVNVIENQTPLLKNKRTQPEQCKFQWNHPNGDGDGGGVGAVTNQTNGNIFMPSHYRSNVGLKMGGGGGLHDLYGAPQSMVVQMQPAVHYPDG
ncbi:transcription factor DIVARICATA-like [Rutidosis leptorrhynchoides]|uniref:transcription factor DIVARICATA-like n=1 Tax=Rutidosis leptorrhynchoides TaxID=125765 RepID=UPI003A9A2686